MGDGCTWMSCWKLVIKMVNSWVVSPTYKWGIPWDYNPLTNWVFPKIVVPQNGWFIMENPIKIDDSGVPLFSETSN